MRKRYVTWDDIQKYIDELYEIIKENKDIYSGIFSFARGGLLLAILLSYKTDLPILTNPCENCIIIDDVINTGKTMRRYGDEKYDKNYFITTMFLSENVWQYYKDDFSLYVKKSDEIIVFPWEII